MRSFTLRYCTVTVLFLYCIYIYILLYLSIYLSLGPAAQTCTVHTVHTVPTQAAGQARQRLAGKGRTGLPRLLKPMRARSVRSRHVLFGVLTGMSFKGGGEMSQGIWKERKEGNGPPNLQGGRERDRIYTQCR